MIRNFISSIFIYLFGVLIVGIYTIALYFFGGSIWPQNIHANLIIDNNNEIRGSLLLAQHLNSDKYFKARTAHKLGDSCDVALYNSSLKEFFKNRYNELSDVYDVSMITPSSSLLDPYITLNEALKQAIIVANVRNIDINNVIFLIQESVLRNSQPFFEIDIVNTTLLNAKLDLLVK